MFRIATTTIISTHQHHDCQHHDYHERYDHRAGVVREGKFVFEEHLKKVNEHGWKDAEEEGKSFFYLT